MQHLKHPRTYVVGGVIGSIATAITEFAISGTVNIGLIFAALAALGASRTS